MLDNETECMYEKNSNNIGGGLRYKASVSHLNNAKQNSDLTFSNSNDISGVKNLKKGERKEEMQSIFSSKHTESNMFETLPLRGKQLCTYNNKKKHALACYPFHSPDKYIDL